jgi:acetylornithine deacetylase/succinyl-diaminopimelate desuccinylase-like protein
MGVPVNPNHGPQRIASGRLILAGNISFPYTDDPTGLAGWRMTGIYLQELAATIRAENPEVDLSFTIREWTDAAESDPASAIADLCRRAVRDEGRRPTDLGFTGITDARFYINDVRIPTVILGPGSLEVAHTADESVAVDDLVAAARIYARVFLGFLGVRS